jgi:hypothetical protein
MTDVIDWTGELETYEPDTKQTWTKDIVSYVGETFDRDWPHAVLINDGVDLVNEEGVVRSVSGYTYEATRVRNKKPPECWRPLFRSGSDFLPDIDTGLGSRSLEEAKEVSNQYSSYKLLGYIEVNSLTIVKVGDA